MIKSLICTATAYIADEKNRPYVCIPAGTRGFEMYIETDEFVRPSRYNNGIVLNKSDAQRINTMWEKEGTWRKSGNSRKAYDGWRQASVPVSVYEPAVESKRDFSLAPGPVTVKEFVSKEPHYYDYNTSQFIGNSLTQVAMHYAREKWYSS